jgi:hypothetical protein
MKPMTGTDVAANGSFPLRIDQDNSIRSIVKSLKLLSIEIPASDRNVKNRSPSSRHWSVKILL